MLSFSAGLRKYLLLTTMVAGAGFSGVMLASPSYAQQAMAFEQTFQIAPQPLSAALTLFGQQSGLQVSVSAAANDVVSPGVSGRMSAAEALDVLLAGSGL